MKIYLQSDHSYCSGMLCIFIDLAEEIFQKSQLHYITCPVNGLLLKEKSIKVLVGRLQNCIQIENSEFLYICRLTLESHFNKR